jgi:outer membrane protein, heavy metal efflux system
MGNVMRFMKTDFIKTIQATVCAVWLSATAYGQVVTLDSVLHAVDLRHPMLQEYDQRVKAQQTYTAGAKSWMAPMVGLGTFMTPYPGQNAEEADRGSVMVSIEQNIPNPAKQAATERYYSSRAAVEELGRVRQFNALRAQAKSAYYQGLVAEEKRKILRESESIVQLMLKLANIRYPYNQGSLGSIYKTEGRLHEIQNMLLMTEGEAEQSRHTLRAIMNLPADAPILVDTTTVVRFDRNAFVADTASLRTQRSDVRQLDKTIAMMRLNQELQKYQAKPEFRFRFDHMQPLGNGMPTQFTAMAMVSIPVAPWASKMYKSETKGMTHDIEAMKRGQDAIVLETRGMLAGMAAQLARMEQQLENYKTRIIPALRKNYQAVMLAYEENREALPVVVDGWEAMNMAQLDYAEKLGEYYQMIVQYEKEVER